MNTNAQGKDSVAKLDTFFLKDMQRFPKNAFRMIFITNHDENSWNGTEFERMGEAAMAMGALSFVVS